MADLRVIRDETPALSSDELQSRGNDLATDIRKAAVDAVRQSMHDVFLERGGVLTPAKIREWRGRARDALEAWQKVDALTSELLREIAKTTDAERTGMRRVVVPDGSGKPGHFTTAWVRDPAAEPDGNEET